MLVTAKQNIWLNQKGGRTIDDLITDSHGNVGVLMFPDKFVGLPSDKSLEIDCRGVGSLFRFFVYQK